MLCVNKVLHAGKCTYRPSLIACRSVGFLAQPWKETQPQNRQRPPLTRKIAYHSLRILELTTLDRAHRYQTLCSKGGGSFETDETNNDYQNT